MSRKSLLELSTSPKPWLAIVMLPSSSESAATVPATCKQANHIGPVFNSALPCLATASAVYNRAPAVHRQVHCCMWTLGSPIHCPQA